MKKVDKAAEALRDICPGLSVTTHDMRIPMPGHGGKMEAEEANFEALNDLVKAADVVFLLTDSRESRWLPTVLTQL